MHIATAAFDRSNGSAIYFDVDLKGVNYGILLFKEATL